MVGDYEVELFSSAVKSNAVSALATLHGAVGLDPATLKLHKEDPRTTHNCPGKNVVKADMIAQLTEALATLHPGDHEPGGAA